MQAFAPYPQFVVSFQVGTELAIGTKGYRGLHPALFLLGYILPQLDCFDRHTTQQFEERECSKRRGANCLKVRFRILSLGGRQTYEFTSSNFRCRGVKSRPRNWIWKLCEYLRTIVHCQNICLIVEPFATFVNSGA
jgi:hypothetical protein